MTRPPVGVSILAVQVFVTALSASAPSRRAGAGVFAVLSWFAICKLALGSIKNTFEHLCLIRGFRSHVLRMNPGYLLRPARAFFCSIRFASKLVVVFSFALLPITAHAQSQSETLFEYDGAGNIVRVITETNDAPPTVSSLTPAFINQEATVSIIAFGNNLVRAEVSTPHPDLIIDRVVATKTSVRFRLSASAEAAIGATTISFTTRLGTATAVMTVAERTPIISTEPNPIVLAPDGVGVSVRLIFDQPFSTDQIYDVAMQDSAIADVGAATITLPAGETVATITATGLLPGSTKLEVNQLSNFLAIAIPVLVVDAQLPNATNSFYAQPVGVSLSVTPPPYAGTGVFFTPQPLGVSVHLAPPPYSGTGTFYTPHPLGVNVYLAPPPYSGTGTFYTPHPLGVSVYLEPPPYSGTGTFYTPHPLGVGVYLEPPPYSGTGTFYTPQPVGAAYGLAVTATTPGAVSAGTSATLTVEGVELDQVTAVDFDLIDGLTITGSIIVNPEGTQMQIPIAVSSSAARNQRVIVFTTPSGDAVFSGGVFQITN